MSADAPRWISSDALVTIMRARNLHAIDAERIHLRLIKAIEMGVVPVRVDLLSMEGPSGQILEKEAKLDRTFFALPDDPRFGLASGTIAWEAVWSGYGAPAPFHSARKITGVGLSLGLTETATILELTDHERESAVSGTPAPLAKPDDESAPPLLKDMPPLRSGVKESVIRDKPFADEAAGLVRSGFVIAKAIRQVRPIDHSRQDKSIERGIRTAYDLHYDRHGKPLS